jgi:hypothetical protein
MKKTTILLLAAIGIGLFLVLGEFRPWDRVGPLGYWQLHLGMTDEDVTAIMGEASKERRRSRHIGGRLSPGMAESLWLEHGLAYDDLPRRHGEKARTGATVDVRQWWGSRYAINVAFDEHGKTVGIYLMTLQRVNW